MLNISDRQKQLLIAIIEEFMMNADAVGSSSLKEKYDLKLSPATIRNEMSELSDTGLLYKEHNSGGRIPTTLGIRYYLDEVMREERIDNLTEVKLREKIFKSKFSIDRILKESTDSLTQLTGYMSIAIVDDVIHSSGFSKIISLPEFRSSEKLQDLASILESTLLLKKMFKAEKSSDEIKILIGEEIGYEAMKNMAIVFVNITVHFGRMATLAVLGPNRMNYGKVIPSIRKLSKDIKDALIGM